MHTGLRVTELVRLRWEDVTLRPRSGWTQISGKGEQVRLLPVSEKFLDGAAGYVEPMQATGLRAELDKRDEKLGAKIRRGSLDKVPYLGIVGERELEAGTLSVRRLGAGDQGSMTMDAFIERVVSEDRDRVL